MLTPGHTNQTEAIRTEATEAEQTEAAKRIKPKTSAALPIIRCALSTEVGGLGSGFKVGEQGVQVGGGGGVGEDGVGGLRSGVGVGKVGVGELGLGGWSWGSWSRGG